jgi:hypothetical protein
LYSPAFGGAGGFASLTGQSVTGKDEKSLYADSFLVSADFVKNFTSSQKALATMVFVDFHLPPSIF